MPCYLPIALKLGHFIARMAVPRDTGEDMIKTLSILISLSMLLATSIPAKAGTAGPRVSKLLDEPAKTNPATKDAENTSTATGLEKRSPLLAGAMSLVLPGSGQLYNEEYLVGGLWMAGEIALYLGAFAYAGAFDSSEDFSLRWRLEGILLLAVAGGFHLFSIFDAVTEAQRVNADIDKFSIMVTPTQGGATVGYGFMW